MSPEAIIDALEVVTAVDFGDYDLFKQRKSLVADIGMDEDTIVAKVRTLQVQRLTFDGRFFDLEIQGVEPVPAAVIFALNEHEDWLDLVAWPIADPSRLATLRGFATMLGEHQLDTCTPWGPPLPVHRTAIGWLRAGCVGVVVLDPRRAARRFLDVDGELLAEDRAHARELAQARSVLVDRAPPILVAERPRRAAA